MSKGLPSKAKVGTPGKTVGVNVGTYFLGLRMERAGILQPGQALMLAATLPKKAPRKGTKK